MLVAALYLATLPTVDYETVAKPLPAVLEELTKLTVTKMRAAKDVSADLLVIRVDDVEIDALRAKIAEAVDGKWTVKSDHLLLERDASAVTRRREAEVKALADALRKEFLENKNEKPAHTDVELNKLAREIDSPYVSGWLLSEALAKIDPSELASIPLNTRVVYSSRPNRMQKRLAGVEPLLQEALAMHNKFASIANNTEVDEPEVDSWEYMQRRQSLKEWAGPLELILIVENSDNSITPWLKVLGADGREVDSDFENFYPWVAREKPKIPEGPAAAATAVLSKEADAMNTLEVASGLSAITEIPFDDAFIARLVEPTKNDPLSLSYSEYITEIGRGFDWDVVASVRDEMWIPPPQESGPILVAKLLGSIVDNQFTRWSQSGSWLTLGPTAMYNLRQVDRSALERLIRSSAKFTPGLLATARFAASSPDETPLGAYIAYLYCFVNYSSSWYDEWVWLRFFDALPMRVKEVALQGGSVIVGDIGPAARSQLEHIICYYPYSDLRTTYEEVYDGDDPNSEPTEAIPNGLPNSAVIHFKATRGFCALLAPKVEGAFAGIVEDMWLVALTATNQHVATAEPHLDPFWIGEGSEIEIELELSKDLLLKASLSDQRVRKSGRTYTLKTAPEPFMKEFQKALDDWRSDGDDGSD